MLTRGCWFSLWFCGFPCVLNTCVDFGGVYCVSWLVARVFVVYGMVGNGLGLMV